MNIIITGTTQGIGNDIEKLLEKEHSITSINRRDNGKNNNLICDLANIHEVEELCKKIKEMDVDVLINNAGGSEPLKFEDLTVAEIEYRMNLNFVAPTLLIQAVIPSMKKKQFGRIVNISSVTGKTPVPYIHIYGAAKAALDNLVRSTAEYYKDDGIKINSICPGSVMTAVADINRAKISVLHGLGEEEYQAEMQESNGMGRMVLPEEIASVVAFLISPAASAINGQSINVCGTMEVH